MEENFLKISKKIIQTNHSSDFYEFNSNHPYYKVYLYKKFQRYHCKIGAIWRASNILRTIKSLAESTIFFQLKKKSPWVKWRRWSIRIPDFNSVIWTIPHPMYECRSLARSTHTAQNRHNSDRQISFVNTGTIQLNYVTSIGWILAGKHIWVSNESRFSTGDGLGRCCVMYWLQIIRWDTRQSSQYWSSVGLTFV